MTVDPIAHLDFTPPTPQCECCSSQCEQHPAGVRCAHTAQFHTKIHAFGFCNNPGLDHGFAVHIVCAACMTHHADLARLVIEGSHSARERIGAYLACTTCAKNLVNVHEIWEARLLNDIP